MSGKDAQKQASPVMHKILQTRSFRYLARHHWLHHHYEDSNYNLLLGGDIILGYHRKPRLQDLEKMARTGLPV